MINFPTSCPSTPRITPRRELNEPTQDTSNGDQDLFRLQFDYANMCRKDPNSNEMGIRLLYALQMITSLVALPIILLIGLSGAALYAINCQNDTALFILQNTMILLTTHVIEVIPCSLAGIFIEITEEIAKDFKHYALKAAEIWLCNYSQSEPTSIPLDLHQTDD